MGRGQARPGVLRLRHRLGPGRPDEIVYVGDHRDNDIVPAKASGLRTAHIRRGPWGYLHADDHGLRTHADWQVSTLTALPSLLT